MNFTSDAMYSDEAEFKRDSQIFSFYSSSFFGRHPTDQPESRGSSGPSRGSSKITWIIRIFVSSGSSRRSSGSCGVWQWLPFGSSTQKYLVLPRERARLGCRPARHSDRHLTRHLAIRPVIRLATLFATQLAIWLRGSGASAHPANFDFQVPFYFV